MTHAGTIVGELTMTTMGTQFLLHNNVKGHKGTARDLAAISYLRNTGGGGPRKMQIAIPGFRENSETEFVEWAHGGSIKKSNLMQALTSLNFNELQPLVNKPPIWNEERHAWTLNFHGRVTRASVKNFQLVRPEDNTHIVLQHGRVGENKFTMDMSWPISPIQAFAVCLSSLHGKLGVE
jgi:tubby-related protein 1